jgi:membrane protein
VLGRLVALARPIVGSAPVAATLRVMERFGNASGGLLAGGLAYAALFAIVPAIFLVVGIAGAFLHDAATRQAIVDTIAGVMPPLRDVATVVLGQASLDPAPASIVGFVILLWGASRFAVAFQDAIGRVMGVDRKRGLLLENLAAVGAVLLVIGALLLGTVVAGLTAFLAAGQAVGLVAVVDAGAALVLGLLPILATVGAVILVYRLVPLAAPRWRSLAVPAVIAGLALTLFARVFVFVAPRLIGAAALLGALASVFAALAWLQLSFQALLIGAAWTADREARAGKG